jgi:4-amino-4-deoxy-L-arabinose transferase-like glycosyltransferase
MDITQQNTFLRDRFKMAGSIIKQFMQTRSLVIAMVSLQLFWLAAIAWTGTSTNQFMIVSLAIYSLLIGLMNILLPSPFPLMLRTLNDWLLQEDKRFILALCLLALSIGIFYAYNQRPWGDEERSFRVATIISTDGLVAGYQESGWLRNKHPPLMPMVYGFTINLLGSNLIHLRLVSVAFLAATSVVVYYLGRELYDRNTGLLGALFFLLFPLVIRLGAAAMMDMQVTLFFAMALLLCLRLLKTPSFKLAAAIGVVIGLGLLTKYIMALILGVLFFCVVFLPNFRKLKYHFAAAILISLSIFAVWLLYANQIGILSGQVEKILSYSGIYHVVTDLEAALPSETSEVAVDSEEIVNPLKSGIFRLGLESFFTRIPSSLGVQLFPLIFAGGLFLFKRRKSSDRFLLFWIGVVFVTLFLTLPDHRYFLPAFPAIAIMIANVVNRFTETRERVALLSLFLGWGNLYLFVDWVREAHLFLLNP